MHTYLQDVALEQEPLHQIVSGTMTRLIQSLLLLFALPLTGATLKVGEEILAVGQRVAGTGVNNPDLQGIRFVLGYGDASNPLIRLFEGVSVTEIDVGRIFVANESSDPAFALFSMMLTNGIDDLLLIGAETVVPNPPSQGAYLQRRESATVNPVLQFVQPVSGPDLEGYRIDRVEMEVLNMTIDSPGRDLNGNGRWSDYSGNVELRVIGAPIPEARSACLLLASLIIPVCRRTRK